MFPCIKEIKFLCEPDQKMINDIIESKTLQKLEFERISVSTAKLLK